MMVTSLRGLLKSGRAGLPLLGLALSGCGGWPHFDYADSPMEEIPEQADGDTAAVQYLHTLHGDVQIDGRIETSGYTLYDEAPFDLAGWYSGDMDWYEFSVWNPHSGAIQLAWEQAGADLDLYLFTVDASGTLTPLSYEAEINDGTVSLGMEDMTPGSVYVVAVAGHVGEAVDYTLLLHFSPEA